MAYDEYGVDKDSDYPGDASGIRRRQKVIDAMMAKGLKPPEGRMVGRVFVPSSPWEGLNYAAQAGLSMYMGKKSDDDITALEERQKTERQKTVAEAMAKAMGREGTPPVPGPKYGEPVDEETAAGTPAVAAVPPDPQGAAVDLALHRSQRISDIGKAMMENQSLKEIAQLRGTNSITMATIRARAMAGDPSNVKTFKFLETLSKPDQEAFLDTINKRHLVDLGNRYELLMRNLPSKNAENSGEYRDTTTAAPRVLNVAGSGSLRAPLQPPGSNEAAEPPVVMGPPVAGFNPPIDERDGPPAIGALPGQNVPPAIGALPGPNVPPAIGALPGQNVFKKGLAPADQPGPAGEKAFAMKTAQEKAALLVAKPQHSQIVGSVVATSDRMISSASELKNHTGLDNITGWFNGRTPTISQAGQNALSLLDTLKDQIFGSAINDIKAASGAGLGSVTKDEGKRLENMWAALKTSQDTPTFRRRLQQIVDYSNSLKNRVVRGYRETHGEEWAPPEEENRPAPATPAKGQPMPLNDYLNSLGR